MSDFPAPAKLKITGDRVVQLKGNIRPRPYYCRGDTQRLVAGDVAVVVEFNTDLKDANWVFSCLQIWNSQDADADVVFIQALPRVLKSASGFTLLLSAPPPTDGYYLDWAIAERYNP
jgi:hypothetical protein